jgi:hypothetical protein
VLHKVAQDCNFSAEKVVFYSVLYSQHLANTGNKVNGFERKEGLGFSNHTTKHGTLVCWLLQTERVWKAANTGRGFLSSSLIWLKKAPPERMQLS